jgi:hypothetical protein
MDFTLKIYQKLLESLQNSGYSFFTFEQYCLREADGKFVILRHDVDLRAAHSLATARVEAELGIKASYYFRVVRQSNKPEIIKAIAALGHEIGYHYEDMSLVKGKSSIAVDHFSAKLAYFRRFYPVKTVCMHGSPTSKIDNRSLWKYYDYRDFGLIGEPYFDIDFTKVFYLTDTGRCWDGDKFSVRDKVDAHFNVSYHSTNEIIHAANLKTLPLQLMITTHPQRWTDNVIEWFVELFMQNAKNTIKRLIVK